MGIEITKSERFDVSADRLWHILADEFDRVGDWARAVDSSAPNLDVAAPDGADIGGRVCQAPGFGAINETFTAFDPTARSYAFKATASKIPGFVRNITNHTRVISRGSDAAEVEVTITADTDGLRGTLIKPLMARQFSGTIDGLLEDLRSYAETGQVSAAKRKALAKAGTRAAA